MTVEPLPFELDAGDFSEAHGTRSPGLHVSAILADLDRIANGQRYAATGNATRQAYFAIGFLWEQILSRLWAETAVKRSAGQLVRPGEFWIDGICMSPDAIDLSDYTLEEYKATYLSSTHAIDDPVFWLWTKQLQCYCRAIGTRSARLRAWFVVGDWRGSGPQVRAWQFHFTDREIDETWQMVRNHAAMHKEDAHDDIDASRQARQSGRNQLPAG